MKALAPYVPLLEKIVGVAVVTAAVALGLMQLANADSVEEEDATDFLLNGPDRERILAALEDHKNGKYEVHNVVS